MSEEREDPVPSGSEAGDERWSHVPVAPPERGRMILFEAEGRRLVLCNAEGTLYVIDDRCPHAGASLSDGRLRGCVVECPFHGGKLDVRNGAPVAPPIRRAGTTYAVRADGSGFAVALPAAPAV